MNTYLERFTIPKPDTFTLFKREADHTEMLLGVVSLRSKGSNPAGSSGNARKPTYELLHAPCHSPNRSTVCVFPAQRSTTCSKEQLTIHKLEVQHPLHDMLTLGLIWSRKCIVGAHADCPWWQAYFHTSPCLDYFSLCFLQASVAVSAIQRNLIPEVTSFLLAHPSVTQDQPLVSTLLCTSKALSSNLAGQVHVDFTTKSSRRAQAFAAWLVKNSWVVQTLKVDLNITCCSEDAEIASNAVVAALQAASAATAARTAACAAAPVTAAAPAPRIAALAAPAAGTAARAKKAGSGPALLYYSDTTSPSATAALLSRLSCCSHHLKQLGLVDINEEVLAQLPREVEVLTLSNCSASAEVLLQLKEKLPHLKELHLTYQPCFKPLVAWSEGVLDDQQQYLYAGQNDSEEDEEELLAVVERALPALPALPVKSLVVLGERMEYLQLDFGQVGKLSGLKRLVLDQCGIELKPAEIAAVLGKCRKLQEVELRGVYVSYGPRPRVGNTKEEAEKVVKQVLDELPEMRKMHVDLMAPSRWN